MSNSAILWMVDCQAPLSMGFSRQEYWSVLPFPSAGDLPDLEIEPMSLLHLLDWQAGFLIIHSWRNGSLHIIILTLVLFLCMCAQSCPTLCDLLDCNLPGSSVYGISKQEYWSRLPFPPPGDLPDLGIKPTSLTSPALAGGFFATSATCKALY